MTYLATRRQLEGMNCQSYEIGIRNRDGKMLLRTWTKEETLKAIPWLKRENAKGADIYVRPAGDKNPGLILADDLNKQQIERLEYDGLAPAVIVETSSLNYQAWIRLTYDGPLSPKVATLISKSIAQRYEADPNSADWRHFGRLAGFTNRKPKHTTENGRQPWVLCHRSNIRLAKMGLETIRMAQEQVLKQDVIVDSQIRLKTALDAPKGVYRYDPVKAYQNQLRTLIERYGENLDLSRADFAICKAMAKQGYSADQIEKTLHQASPELPKRKLGHEQDYCTRTVQAAFLDQGVKQHLESKRVLQNVKSIGLRL